MVAFVIAFAAGVWLLQQQPALPAPAWIGGLVPGLLMLSGLRGAGRVRRHLCQAWLLVLCAAAGFLWAALLAHGRMSAELPVEWEGRDIAVVGVVAGLPQAVERGTRFEFDVEHALTPGAVVPRRVVLSWWGDARRDGAAETLPRVAAGERWQLTVRLKRPHGFANPHGFDYEAFLLERGIRATGYVRPRGDSRRLATLVPAPAYWIEAMRERMRSRLQAVLGDASAAGVVIALAIGDQRAIPAGQWQTFTRTGVNHLMSISGLHVTMLSGLMFVLVNRLWRRSARLTLRLPAVKAAAAAGLVTAVVYALIAGFGVPAQRTVFMLAVVAAALWSGRITTPARVLAGALLVVLVLDPWAVLAAGFWLSFGAVAIILFVAAGRLRPPHWLEAWARVQWAVTLALVPLLLALFQQVSLISPVANALAIPVVSLVVVPLALAGLIVPVDALLQLAQSVMAACVAALQWLSALPAVAWEQHAPPSWTVVTGIAGAIWLLLPRGFPARWIGIVALLPMFLIFPEPPVHGTARLTVLDVGQGLSIVVQTRHHALLFDTGPAFGPLADSGNRIIVPYLRASGVRRLERLIASHDDADHTGGAWSVLQAVPVTEVLTSLPDLDPLILLAEHEQRCYAGQQWTWDGVRFEMLYPDDASYAQARIRDNDRSCVLRISTARDSVLIPADIERRGERVLLEQAPEKLQSTVLIAPHQGSKTSSSEPFVQAVAPQVVIFPVGYRNRFRHPHAEVVARYRQLGAALYRTDEGGAIRIDLGTAGTDGAAVPAVSRYRDHYVRYWHASRDGRGEDDGVPVLW